MLARPDPAPYLASASKRAVLTRYHRFGTLNEDQQAVPLHYVTWFGVESAQTTSVLRNVDLQEWNDPDFDEARRKHAEAISDPSH